MPASFGWNGFGADRRIKPKKTKGPARAMAEFQFDFHFGESDGVEAIHLV